MRKTIQIIAAPILALAVLALPALAQADDESTSREDGPLEPKW